MKAVLYTLPLDIEVLAEFPAKPPSNRYCRVLINPHPLFDAKVSRGRMLVRRSRAVATSAARRKLKPSEHVHHKEGIAAGRIKFTPPPILRGADNNKAKFTEESVQNIRARAAGGASASVLAKEFGVVVQSIYNIINRTTWSHI